MIKPYVTREAFARHFPDNLTYPKTTAQVVIELRSRNIDARPARLEAIVSSGDVSLDGELWSDESIDKAAAVLCDFGFLTPRGGLCEYLAIAGDVELDARFAAVESFDGAADDLVLTVIPGWPGADISARVEYRPLTAAESAARDALIGK